MMVLVGWRFLISEVRCTAPRRKRRLDPKPSAIQPAPSKGSGGAIPPLFFPHKRSPFPAPQLLTPSHLLHLPPVE